MIIKNDFPDWSDKTILIAEDLDSNYTILSALLSRTHAHLIRANNGAEAINIVRNQTFDINVILMDITMPDIDGIEAMKEIRNIVPNQVIIAQTAHTINGLLDGEEFNDFLSKPIRRRNLLTLLSKYLS